MTRPLPPRAAGTKTTPERRALQDVLAWPIALTLLVAESEASQKALMIKLIINLLGDAG